MSSTMRGSTQNCFVLLACVASLFLLAQARPQYKDGTAKNSNLQNIKDDLEWESKWWTPTEKDEKDSKDSWKVFKTEKPAVRRRWWEEDWNEEEWWAPKDTSNSVSSKKSYVTSKKGEEESDVYSKDTGLDTKISVDKPIQDPKKAEVPAKEKVLPVKASKETKLDPTPKGTEETEKVDSKVKAADDNKKLSMPVAETPREKLDPVLNGDVMVSPFEDTKPGPYSGSRDELPTKDNWEYHQLSGFGKYIDQGKGKGKEMDNADKQEASKVDKETKKMMAEKLFKEKVQKELAAAAAQEKEAVKLPAEKKQKNLDEFYGFGLESKPAAPATVPSQDKKEKIEKAVVKKLKEPAVEKPGKENYNKGIIYDVIPGSPDLTHSVKKDLSNSEYMKDFVSTKANPQTSPNPPPPGLDEAEKKSDSETTPPAPIKALAKKQKSFVKSRPLRFCKLDAECRRGRMCQDGMCVCLPKDGCAGHHHPVCGSDGLKYPSHCELHRTACVTHLHIKVDRLGKCFIKHDAMDKMEAIEKQQYKDHLLPKLYEKDSLHEEEDSDSDDEDDSQFDDSQFDDSDFDYDGDDDDEEEYDDDDVEENENADTVDSEEDDDVEENYDSDEEEDEDDVDDIDAWLKGKIEKVKLKSKKIYDYSKTLKKDSKGDKDSDNKVDKNPWDHVQEEMGQEFKGKKGKKAGALKMEDGYQADASYQECTKQELAKFKRQLLDYFCQRFQEPRCKLEVKKERQYLANLMFSYLDIDTDYQLTSVELKSRQKSEDINKINSVCRLSDILWFDDIFPPNDKMSLDEFEDSFNHLDITEDGFTEKSESGGLVIHIIPTLATVGNGLELKCGLSAKGSDTVWRRHGINIHDLSMVELLVLDDGSLFFSKMGVHHMGNYSCEDSTNPSILQIHSLKVQMPPIVKVSPHSQIEPAVMDVKLRCHAEGVPKPTISWSMNNVPLSPEPHHYSFEDNNDQLIIHKADYERDTGAYKCVAKNQAGTSEDVSSIFIIGDKERSAGMGFTSIGSGKFAMFHDQGYTAYNPDDCLKHRNVHGDFGYFKFIPDNLDGPLRLCDDGQDCSWGQVVNVKNLFLYVSQPAMNRIVVIETSKNWIPVQVIGTDKTPVDLHYVEHLDQVWVVCWNGDADASTKTLQVVRDASKYIQHRAVHTEPVGNRFDLVQSLFIAPGNDLHHSFDYGYVTHNGQEGVTKLDLDNMRYTKAVDLSAYDCVPRSLAFVPIGGHVVVECVSPVNHQTRQLVMDYITDAVVSNTVLSGHPYVSPDSRHVVTVDDLTGKVSVAGVNDEGVLEAAYEVTVSASISDVAFYPTSGHGYLLILTSADDDNIITINLSTGKVDKIKGTRRRTTSSDWHPSPVKRAITSGDVFADYLLAPSKSSISIVDMELHKVKCEFTDAPRSKAAVFVGRQ